MLMKTEENSDFTALRAAARTTQTGWCGESVSNNVIAPASLCPHY